ncbi:MAG: CotH kinase family protein [Bacteroidales bacterium]|nr:CotH kinase family protein [Bacteroidales bacterium]
MKKLITILSIFSFLFYCSYAQDPTIDHWEMIFSYEQPARYLFPDEDPAANWNTSEYNDASWGEFMNLLGYGGLIQEVINCCGFPDLDLPQVSTFYVRSEFTVEDTSTIEKLMLSITYEDAFIAYINGTEVARANIGISGDPSTYSQLADTTRHNEFDIYWNQFPPGFVIDKQILSQCLITGTNVIAYEIHNDESVPDIHNFIAFLFAALKDESSQFGPMDGFFPVGIDVDSSNLPLVVLETYAGEIIPDEPKITADLKIIDTEGTEYNLVTDDANVYDGLVAIELRGSSSLYYYPKKSFTFETRDNYGDNLNVSILGMPKENDWVLYAPYGDKSLIRNVITYKLVADLGHYAPRTRMVELIKNGNSYGVYVLTEKIKCDNNRVDIASLNPDEVSGLDLTGGYIIKIDKKEGEFDGWQSKFGSADSEFGKTYFQYVYPKYDEIVDAQKEYIQQFMHYFETNLRSETFDDPVIGYTRLIDVESFIDYFIINELTKNIDGYRISTFLYKDRDDHGGKLHAGPVWDYNLAFGNADYCEGYSTEGWSVDFTRVCPSDSYKVPFWWDRLLQDENFTIELKDRWDDLRTDILSEETLFAAIDSLVDLTFEARVRNYAIWQEALGNDIWPNYVYPETYDEEISYMKSWISDRLEWIDDNIGETRERRVYVPIDNTEFTEYVPFGAFPNPFNDQLTFTFELEKPHSIKIDVYNLNGQIINTVIYNEFSEGYHEIYWNGTGLSGNMIHSGVYIYTVTIDKELKHTGRIIKQ